MLLYHLLFRSIPMAANHLLNQWCPSSPVPMCIAMLRWINQGLSAGYIFCATFCISALNLVWVMGNQLVANSQITVVIELPHKPNTTVYSKKYAHSFCFVVLCCGYTLTDFPISIRLTSLALWQSNDCPSASKATLMNMDKYLMWIHYEQLHNHNKAKHNITVCIFLGIYCMAAHHVSKGAPISSMRVRYIWLLLWVQILIQCAVCNTVYPNKYAHGFVVLCFVVVMQSFIMNSH